MRAAVGVCLLAGSAWVYTQDDTFPVPQSGLIVSVMPGSTEMVYAAGQEHRLAGVTTLCTYPPEARAKPKIGDIVIDMEKVLALRAQYVVGFRIENARTLERLERMGLTVIPTDANNFEEIAAVLRRLGGEEAAQELERRVTAVRPPPRMLSVFYEATAEPIFTPGPGSYVDEVIRRAGGRNAFGDLARPWMEIPWELVLSRDPEVILIGHDAIERARLRPGWGELKAVRTGEVHVVDLNQFLYPTPRLADGLERLSGILHDATRP